MTRSNQAPGGRRTFAHWLWTPMAAAALLAGCGGGGGDAISASGRETAQAAAAADAGVQLPYDIYLPGTLTQWAQQPANKFSFDAARGVYSLHGVLAGPAAGDGRKFKITGLNWQHQFGLGTNGPGTSVEQSTVHFTGTTSITTLQHYGDSKDIYLPLESDATDPSGKTLLDFDVKVLEPGDTPSVQLTITQDLPTLTKTLNVIVGSLPPATLVYRGHGAYVGSVYLQSGANTAVVADTAGKEYQGSVTAGQGAAQLTACSGPCATTMTTTEAYFYEVTVSAPRDGAMSISLRKLSYDEAKAAYPHFDADGPIESHAYQPYAQEPGGRVETVAASVSDRKASPRVFTFSSTMDQRDNGSNYRVIKEDASRPTVRTGNLYFDGLFAMAVDDARLNSVSTIQDGNYNDGQPIPCECFQTGEKWTYVWTRDLSYATNLGLANLDPKRVVSSLLFKTSGLRQGVSAPAAVPAGTTQIVQDTGSGGSWPVSTDRVSWAWGAGSVLNNLADADLAQFSEQAYAALRGTVEADRAAAFDAKAGLYGGEQSYMDWRTQTYAPWIVNNLSRMASSKALSTNIGHYQALRLTARLAAQKGELPLAAKYSLWARRLKAAINATFWLDDTKQYASLTTAGEDPAPLHKFDMLGTSLAVLSGVATDERAREAMARYPHAPFGVPVYYPQQPNVYVYHNRALWPFVTAYALKAAAAVENPRVAANAIDSLMRGAALNLSNMENLEWLTGKPAYDDGPAINSRRQLWSVGAYLSMVVDTMFGYRVEESGLRIEPFLTTNARRAMGSTDIAALANLSYKGRPVKIVLHLPAAMDGDGYYRVASVKLNGRYSRGVISAAELGTNGNVVEVTFGGVKQGDARITMAAEVNSLSHNDARVFSPEVPTVQSITPSGNALAVVFTDDKNAAAGVPVRYNIYRDGELVQADWKSLTWTDPDPRKHGKRVCYAVEAVFATSRNRSHHSEPFCQDDDGAQTIAVSDPRVQTNVAVTPPSDGIAEPTLREWGKPTDVLAVTSVELHKAGSYGIVVNYNNHRQGIDTGVTNAVKLVRVLDARGLEAARGVVQMPNVDPRDGGQPIRASTTVQVDLQAGTYRVELQDFLNMSYLASNGTYSGSGGKGGPINTASIAAIRVTRLGPLRPGTGAMDDRDDSAASDRQPEVLTTED